VQAQATEVAGHLALGDLAFVQPGHLRKQWPQLPVAKALDLQGQEHQYPEEGLYTGIAEAQSAGALPFGSDDRALEAGEGLRPEAVVVADGFHFQDPPVGREADRAQLGQVVEEPPHLEVIGVVDGGFGPQRRTPFPALVILFEVGVFVVDVQGRDDPVGNDARPTSAVGGGLSLHLASKDQLHLFWSAQIDVLADDLLEELPAVHRAVPHLGQRELRLPDRELVAVAGFAVAGGKGMGQDLEPLAEEALDLLFAEAVGQTLGARRLLTAQEAVVESLKADPALGELAFEVFVPVDAELGGVGKAGAELQKEGPEVLVDAVEVIVVDRLGSCYLRSRRIPAPSGLNSGSFYRSCRAAWPDTAPPSLPLRRPDGRLTNEAGPRRSETILSAQTTLLHLAWSEAPPH